MEDKLKRYTYLRWKILEYKLMYYKPELVHKSWHEDLIISDQVYDSLEKECNTLAEELGKPKIDYVDFPQGKPSADLVLSKLSQKKGFKRSTKQRLN